MNFVVIWCFVHGVCSLVHVFECKEKNQGECAENVRHHCTILENQIKIRKWNWVGHTLHKETGAIEKTALDWNPQECRRRGRPKRTWRRTIEDEIRSTRRS